jgi:hypothetical protein
MLKRFLIAGLIAVVSACATTGPDAQGRYIFDERSAALGNLTHYLSCGKDCTTLVTRDPCTVADITGCGFSDERSAVLTAWKAGKLFVRDGKTEQIVQVPPTAKGGN